MPKLAAPAGIDVPILTPEEPDNALLYFAVYAFVGPMLDAGVKVHWYQAGFQHGKAILVDNQMPAITTANLDNRSFRLAFKSAPSSTNRHSPWRWARFFKKDFLRFREMATGGFDEKPFWFHLASRAAYLMAAVL